MSTKKLIVFTLILVGLLGCEAGLSVQDQAATMVAETAAAAPPTELPAPTDTQAPSATPTEASTPTPTGPLVFKDDFSKKTDAWGKCDACEWQDGKLYFGPFPPSGGGASDQIHYLLCKACGEHLYFHASADITFAEGQGGDRTYGLASVVADKFLAGIGITPFQLAGLEKFNFLTGLYEGTKFAFYGAVKPGGATNHVQLDARPNSSGTVDYFGIVNKKTIIFLLDQPAEPSNAALYFDWHSVGVAVDNFEFEEIVP